MLAVTTAQPSAFSQSRLMTTTFAVTTVTMTLLPLRLLLCCRLQIRLPTTRANSNILNRRSSKCGDEGHHLISIGFTESKSDNGNICLTERSCSLDLSSSSADQRPRLSVRPQGITLRPITDPLTNCSYKLPSSATRKGELFFPEH